MPLNFPLPHSAAPLFCSTPFLITLFLLTTLWFTLSMISPPNFYFKPPIWFTQPFQSHPLDPLDFLHLGVTLAPLKPLFPPECTYLRTLNAPRDIFKGESGRGSVLGDIRKRQDTRADITTRDVQCPAISRPQNENCWAWAFPEWNMVFLRSYCSSRYPPSPSYWRFVLGGLNENLLPGKYLSFKHSKFFLLCVKTKLYLMKEHFCTKKLFTRKWNANFWGLLSLIFCLILVIRCIEEQRGERKNEKTHKKASK